MGGNTHQCLASWLLISCLLLLNHSTSAHRDSQFNGMSPRHWAIPSSADVVAALHRHVHGREQAQHRRSSMSVTGNQRGTDGESSEERGMESGIGSTEGGESKVTAAGESTGSAGTSTEQGAQKQDHPWLLHHDKRALDRFGSPVVGSSELPFEASSSKLPWTDMRALQRTATCQPVACPAAGACFGDTGGLDFATCHAPEREGPWDLSRVLVLRRVYVNNEGVVFNKSRIFNMDDCTLGTKEDPQPWHSHRKGSRVVHLDRAFNLVHHWGKNFYHSMVEVLPMFFALAAFLREDPSIPVLMKQNLYKEYERYGEKVTGIEAAKLNVVFPINLRVQVFVRELIQPQYPKCMEPDEHTLTHLRRHFFLHPEGIPFLDEDLIPKPHTPRPLVSPDGGGTTPPALIEDWKVTLFLRPRGWARSLVNEEGMVKALEDKFGRDKLVVVRKDMDIHTAMRLFHQTRLLVSVHGASLTNMLFMPEGAAVLEVRLTQYNKKMYEDMATRTGLRYYPVFVEGSKGTPVMANMTDVDEQLEEILKSFQQGWKAGNL